MSMINEPETSVLPNADQLPVSEGSAQPLRVTIRPPGETFADEDDPYDVVADAEDAHALINEFSNLGAQAFERTDTRYDVETGDEVTDGLVKLDSGREVRIPAARKSAQPRFIQSPMSTAIGAAFDASVEARGDIGKAVLKGVGEGAANTAKGVLEIITGPNASLVPDPFKLMYEAFVEIQNAFIGDPSQIEGGIRELFETVAPDLTNWLAEPYDNETLGNLVQNLSQFATPAVAAAAGIKAISSANAFVRSLGWGAIADYFAFDPMTPTATQSLIEAFEHQDPEQRWAVSKAAINILGKEEGQNILNRMKMQPEGALIGLTFEAALQTIMRLPQGPRVAAEYTRAAAEFVRKRMADIGMAAEGRMAERAVTRSTTLNMGVDPTDIVDPLLAAAGRALGLRNKPLQAEGGVRLPEAKTSENLRLHQQRITKMEEKGAAYPGAPKNPRTVIKAPEGSDLPDFVIGAVTPEDWRVRIEAAMTPDEIQAASKWYDTVYDEFDRVTGGNKEESRKLANAWLAAQQNESPSNALASVVYMYEQIQRGVPIDQIKGKGLPQANKAALAALRNADIESGVGQKIADFFDSADGKNVRSIMGNDPAGGSPFVVDVHTGRDTGLVDQELVNHLTRLGYDVPDDVITDLAGGGIKGGQYESRVLFGHQLTDHLNDMNWMGRSDWEPREIQAIGWSQLTRMYGGEAVGGDVAGAIQRSTRRLSMEVDPGAGSPWAAKYGDDYSALGEPDRYAINEKVTARAVELVNQREGINLGGIVHGTGGWELYTNPSTVQQGVISRETARSAAARLALYLNQTEVWVNSAKGMTKAPAHYGIDIVEAGSQNLRSTDKLLELWEMIVEADPTGLIRGYQPIKDTAGNVGIRIIVDKDAMKAWAKENKSNLAGARDAVNEFFANKIDDIIERVDYNIEKDLNEIELDKVGNDWTVNPDGQSHKDNIRDAGRSSSSARGGTDLDLDRAELEKLFGDLIGEAKGRAPTAEGRPPDIDAPTVVSETTPPPSGVF